MGYWIGDNSRNNWNDKKFQNDEVFKLINKNYITLNEEDIKAYNIHLDWVRILFFIFFEYIVFELMYVYFTSLIQNFKVLYPYIVKVLCQKYTLLQITSQID